MVMLAQLGEPIKSNMMVDSIAGTFFSVIPLSDRFRSPTIVMGASNGTDL